MSRALRLILLASTVLMGALSASLFIAFKTRPYPSLRQVRAILFDNWNVYGLFQLNVGLLLAAAWILCVHRRKSIALLWVLGIALVGHIATLAYLLVRAASARTITDVLRPRVAPEDAVSSTPVIQPCSAAFNVELPEPTNAAEQQDDFTPAPSVMEDRS